MWFKILVNERVFFLKKWYELIVEYKEEFVDLIIKENGKLY